MKLIGNPIGMKVYPVTEKNIKPTKHKYGADLTWSAHTDTYKPTLIGHGMEVEYLMFKYNLQGTILLNRQTDGLYENEIKAALETGRFSSGQYFRASQDDYKEQVDWYNKVTEDFGAYWSYANGNRQKDEFVLKEALVTRLSQGGDIDYDFEERLSHACASIFNYNARDYGQEQAIQIARKALQQAIEENGWYNDFSHWHWADTYGGKDQFEKWLTDQAELLSNVNYVSLGAGEAVEYMFVRKAFKRGGIRQEGNELVVQCDVRDEWKLPYKTINTELSVEVDLTDTILEGKEVEATHDLIKKDTNTYIVQIPYSNRDGFRAIRLKETDQPNYLELNKPIIERLGNGVFKTNVPTKAVLFSKSISSPSYEVVVESRINKLNTEHIFSIEDLSKEYYVGIISEFNQSLVIKV